MGFHIPWGEVRRSSDRSGEASVLTMALTTLQTYTASFLWEQSLDGFSKKYRLLLRISKQMSMMSSSNFQVRAREKKEKHKNV